MEIFDILGPHSQPSALIDVKFCTAKRTKAPVGTAEFDLNRCNESPLRGEKPDFWPVSKNNTGSLPLRGNPASNNALPLQRTYQSDATSKLSRPAVLYSGTVAELRPRFCSQLLRPVVLGVTT